jgi:hypothetical protein
MASICEQWFEDAPGLESFVLRSLLRELADAWNDQQGVPASEVARFRHDFLPPLSSSRHFQTTRQAAKFRQHSRG